MKRTLGELLGRKKREKSEIEGSAWILDAIEKDETEKPRTETRVFSGIYTRNEEDIKNLYIDFLNDASAFAAVQIISIASLSAGFRIEGGEEDGRKEIYKSFERSYPFLYVCLRDSLITGDGWALIIPTKGKHIYSLFPLDPLKMKIIDGKYYSKPKDYAQPQPIKGNVLRITPFPRSDISYGHPLLLPARSALKKKQELDENVAVAIMRHGFPRYQIVCKPDQRGQYPTDAQLDELERKFKKLKTYHEFVTSDKVDIKAIDVKGVPEILDYLQYFTDLAATGCLVPAEAMGMAAKGGTYATSKTRSEFFLMNTITYYQQIVQSAINSQILIKDNKDFDMGEYRFVLNPARTMSMAEKIEHIARLGDLIEAEVLTKEEIRNYLGL